MRARCSRGGRRGHGVIARDDPGLPAAVAPVSLRGSQPAPARAIPASPSRRSARRRPRRRRHRGCLRRRSGRRRSHGRRLFSDRVPDPTPTPGSHRPRCRLRPGCSADDSCTAPGLAACPRRPRPGRLCHRPGHWLTGRPDGAPAVVPSRRRARDRVRDQVLADAARRLERVPTDRHFFTDLGADSLVMSQFCARIRKRADLPRCRSRTSTGTPRSRLARRSRAGPRRRPGRRSAAASPSMPVSRPTAPRYVLCGALQLLAFLGGRVLGALCRPGLRLDRPPAPACSTSTCGR